MARNSSQGVELVAAPGSSSAVLGRETHPELFDDDTSVPVNIALDELLSELGQGESNGKVTVFKIEKTGKKEWLFECPPAEFSFSDLQREYGGGTYRIIIYGPDPTSGHYGMRSNKTYDIGPARKIDQPVIVQPQINLAEQIAAALKPIQEQMLTIMQTIVGGGSTSRQSMLAEFKMMAEIFGNRQAQHDPIELMQKLMGLIPKATALKDEEGNSAPEWTVLSQGLDILKEIISKAQENKAPPNQLALPMPVENPVAPHSPVIPVPPAAVASVPTVQPSEDDVLKIMFKSYLVLAVNAAKADSPVQSYAEIVYEQAPEDVIKTLTENPAWFSELEKILPDVTPHKVWFEKLRAEVLEYIKEDAAEPKNS